MQMIRTKENQPPALSGEEALFAYKNRLLNEQVVVDVERVKVLTDVYRETDGEPHLIRRAKFFERLLREKTIFIDENPIIGSVANRPNAVYPTPEFSCRWMKRELEAGTLHLGLGPVAAMSKDDRKIFLEAIDYWEEKCVFYKGSQLYNQIFAGEASVGQLQGYGAIVELIWSFPQGSVSPDYEKVLKVGINGIIDEVVQHLANLPISYEFQQQRYFYEAALMTLRALIAYCKRLVALAREMAEKEQDPARQEQLFKIAEVCEQVPANPARSFREACQTVWMIYLGYQAETPTSAIVLGRLGQYLYPYFKRDMELGRLTGEEVIQTLGWLFLKIQGHGMFFSSRNFAANSGQTSSSLTVGGLTPEGKPAVNELEYLMVETQKRLLLTQPTLTLLWNEKLPEDFLLKCIDLIKTGIGQPMILNNAKMIEHFLNWYPGMTLEEARAGANVGCVPTRPVHAHSNFYGGYPSMPKMLEIVLHNGKDPSSGVRLGPESGNTEEFTSFEQLQAAVDQQIAHFVSRGLTGHRISAGLFAELIPVPFQSCFVDDCIVRGKDLQAGGAKYSTNALLPVGAVDLGNSLAAIKKLVFEDKRFTMNELKRALEANFEGNGFSEIGMLCQRASKYGNDDDYVDAIVEHCYTVFAREHLKHKDSLGNIAHPESYSVSTHNALGQRCGAMPSGRKANLPFTDATTSAYPGTDVEGPTALAKSATKVMDVGVWGSNHTNMKFHPSALAGMQGARNFLALIKTYCELGGKHLQFNCVSADTLKKAQNNPRKFTDLVVRVAGFSSYFIHLDKSVQDEIIKRTELQFG